MSMDATTAVESGGNDRSIESDRLSRALTEGLTVRDGGKLQYLVGHGDAEYLVDVEAGTCECPDYRHRGKQFVCKHALQACIHHAFRSSPNTRLVARVLRAIGDAGCPHDVRGCAGPTKIGARGLPCEGCIATAPGHWVVYQRLTNGEVVEPDVDRGAGVATDGGLAQDATVTKDESARGCDTCSDERLADRKCARLPDGSVAVVCEDCYAQLPGATAQRTGYPADRVGER